MTLSESSKQYGSSVVICDYIVKHQLKVLKPSEVVDFGAGGGKNGQLVREVLGRNCQLTAVEGFTNSAKMLAEQKVYDRVDTALLQEWAEQDTGLNSVAILGDVIEHLTPPEIHRFMRKCLNKFGYIIVVCPLHDIFQDEVYGNPLEVHRSYITARFFDRYRPIEKHIIEGESYTMMNLLIASKTKSKPIYHQVAWRTFHMTMLVLQPLGLARPCVVLLKRFAQKYKGLLR